MVSSRSRGFANAFLLLHLGVASGVYWLSFVVWDILLYHGGVPLRGALFYNEFLLLGFLLMSESGARRVGLARQSAGAAERLARRQTTGVMFTLFAAALASQDRAFPRAFFFSLAPLLYLISWFCHLRVRPWLITAVFRERDQHRVVLVGSFPHLPEVQRWVDGKRALGLHPVGYLCDAQEAQETVDGIPHLGSPRDLAATIESQGIHQVIILQLVRRNDIIQEAVSICEREGVRLLVMSDLEEHFRHSVTVFEDDGQHLIALREEPLENPMNRFLKRALDIAVSLPVVIFVLPPIIAIVWLFQRRQSPGPVFYAQQRTGLQNQPFQILKFRTMRVHRGPEDRQATQNDDRIYPAGRWLRRLSIDEIPQFLNVLRGDMSVVGPRPHLMGHNAAFSKVMGNYFVRSMVKPGISGLAQVRGYRGEMRTELDIIRRVSSDIDYLENWSFFLDCWIILRTALQVFFPPKTAY